MKTTPLSSKTLGIVLSSAILYAVAFVFLFDRAGGIVAALGLVPAMIAGWYLGWRGGLVFGILHIPLSMLLFIVVGQGWQRVADWQSLMGNVVIIVGGTAVGWVGQQLRQVKYLSEQLTQEQRLLQQEIVERKRIEVDLQTSEAKHRLLLNNIPTAVLALQKDMTILYCNQVYAQQLGQTPAQLTGQKITTLLPAIEHTPAFQLYTQVQQTGQPQEIETQTGSQYILERITPIPEGILSIMEDTTTRKQAEEAIAMNRMKTEFLAKVSHELRTPLSAILGYADMLQEGIIGDLTAKQQDMVNRVIVNTERLLSHVNGMLDQTQMELGKLQFNITSFPPQRLLENMHAALDVMAQEKKVAFTSECRHMPPVIWGDFQKLQQILINLAGNGIKFTETGQVSVLLAAKNSQQWQIVVSDTGRGIPLAAQSYIFEPFRQVDGSNTRQSSGVGLGLSIVKQLVTHMAGEVVLQSEPGLGSTFTVTLPWQLADSAVPVTNGSIQQPTQTNKNP